MALGFMFRLELEDGTPADPPMFRSADGVTGRERKPPAQVNAGGF